MLRTAFFLPHTAKPSLSKISDCDTPRKADTALRARSPAATLRRSMQDKSDALTLAFMLNAEIVNPLAFRKDLIRVSSSNTPPPFR